MSAAELRQAAETLREDFQREDVDSIHEAEVMVAVADLLERIAEDREMDPYMAKHFDEASLTVARLINGGGS